LEPEEDHFGIELIITCAVSILVDMLSQMYELNPAGVTTSNALSEHTTLKQ
jgi:hypothetical protein